MLIDNTHRDLDRRTAVMEIVMVKKPFVIMVSSQKGGVGKTTISLNLAVALIFKKFSVLLVDTDIISASLSEQLGIKPGDKGYIDIVNSGVKIEDAMFAYEPIDLYIIPGNPAREIATIKEEHLVKFYGELTKQNFDFIIIDTPPGLFRPEIARYLNDVAILTTPDSVSSVGSERMARYCERFKLEHRLLINRLGFSKYDLEKEEVEKLYGDVAFQTIPEDKIIAESISKRKSAYMIDRQSDFSLAIEELANAYSLKIRGDQNENLQTEFDRETKPSFFERFAKWIFKR